MPRAVEGSGGRVSTGGVRSGQQRAAVKILMQNSLNSAVRSSYWEVTVPPLTLAGEDSEWSGGSEPVLSNLRKPGGKES